MGFVIDWFLVVKYTEAFVIENARLNEAIDYLYSCFNLAMVFPFAYVRLFCRVDW